MACIRSFCIDDTHGKVSIIVRRTRILIHRSFTQRYFLLPVSSIAFLISLSGVQNCPYILPSNERF